MNIQERILIYRAKNRLTQEEMAQRLDVSRILINQIENGKTKPSKIFLLKMELLEKGE